MRIDGRAQLIIVIPPLICIMASPLIWTISPLDLRLDLALDLDHHPLDRDPGLVDLDAVLPDLSSIDCMASVELAPEVELGRLVAHLDRQRVVAHVDRDLTVALVDLVRVVACLTVTVRFPCSMVTVSFPVLTVSVRSL